MLRAMTTERWFRGVGFLEAVSFLVLLLIAMPLKYVWGMPEAVRFTGMAHGLLFVAYCHAALLMAGEKGWPWRVTLLALCASVLPAGPFVFDWKFLGRDESRVGC